MMSSTNKADRRLYRTSLSAMFLAIALVLPFLTGQIPQIGSMLCPMHLPVLLCGYFVGPWNALLVGFTVPILRSFLFGMPPIMPNGLAMAIELAAYGSIAGWLYQAFPKKKVFIYLSLILAMIGGRLIWGTAKALLLGVTGAAFGWEAFLAGAVLNSIPGIIVQIVLVPILVMVLKKNVDRKG